MYSLKDTILEVFNVFGRTNWFCFIFAGLLLFVTILVESEVLLVNGGDDPLDVEAITLIMWATAYSLYVYSLSLPIYRVKNQPHGHDILVFSIFMSGVALIVLITASYMRLGEVEKGAGIYGSAIAAIVTIMAFMLKVQMDTYIRASTQSLNVLLQMRSSEVYQTHVRNVNMLYSPISSGQITDDDIDHVLSLKQEEIFLDEPDGTCPKERSIDRAKFNAMHSQIQILNYFEFLALGIKRMVLDEELLYESLGSILMRNFDRSKFLFVKVGDEKNYILVKGLHERWSKRRKAEVLELKKG